MEESKKEEPKKKAVPAKEMEVKEAKVVKPVKVEAKVAKESKPKAKEVVKDVNPDYEVLAVQEVVGNGDNRQRYNVAKMALAKMIRSGRIYYHLSPGKGSNTKIEVRFKK